MKPSPHRLAIVASHVVQYQAPLYRALARDPRFDLTVLFCSRAGAESYKDRELGVDVRWDTPLLEGYRHVFLRNLSQAAPGRPWSAVNPGLVALLLRERYDAVVVPGYAVVSYWLAYLGAWLSGTPVFFRGEAVLRPGRPAPLRLLKQLLVGFLLRRTAACLSIGTQSRNFYRAFAVPDERVYFSPYAVDHALFDGETERWRARRDQVRDELGLPRESIVVLFVGKLVPRKRPLDLLEALHQLDDRFRLLFVGEGPLRAEIDRSERLAPRITLAGFRNQSELPRFYAAADVFALPSEHEVAPLVLNEAMCAALPLVLSDAVPSAPDMVEPGVNGAIYRCGDARALAAAILQMAREPQGLARMGARSREKARGRSLEVVAAALDAALTRHGRRAARAALGNHA